MSRPNPGAEPAGSPESSRGRLVLSWLVVGVPLAYGVWQTLVKASKLFTG